jgi:hypothetical protein
MLSYGVGFNIIIHLIISQVNKRLSIIDLIPINQYFYKYSSDWLSFLILFQLKAKYLPINRNKIGIF